MNKLYKVYKVECIRCGNVTKYELTDETIRQLLNSNTMKLVKHGKKGERLLAVCSACLDLEEMEPEYEGYELGY